MDDVIQIAGAILILAAFIAAQRGAMSPQSVVYLLLNLVGSLILAVLAAIDSDWGFLLLEGVWAIVSAWGLYGMTILSDPSGKNSRTSSGASSS